MSKFLFLLLSVAAFQAVSSFPTDYLEDPAPKTTWSILKDAMGEIKNNWIKKGEELKKNTIKMVMDKICMKQDFEEDFDSDESSEGGLVQLYEELLDLMKKIPKAMDQEKKKMVEKMENVKGKICDILEAKYNKIAQEDETDEERGWKGSFGKFIKKGLKKLKGAMKKAMKKGAKFIKDNAVKMTPLECEGSSCNSCIKMVIPMQQSMCMKYSLIKESVDRVLVLAFTLNDVPHGEKRIKLGAVASSIDLGAALGKVSFKGIEGKAKSSKGKANVNFCVGVLADKFNIGVKLCSIFENGKLKVKCSPKLFAGGKDDNGDIIQLHQNGEDGAELDADEFEVD